MELRNLLGKTREIKLFEGELAVTYDPTAIVLSEMASVSNLQLIAKAVKAWDLTFDGKPVTPTLEGMTGLPVSAQGVLGEVAMEIYLDMAAFPKGMLKLPRANTSETSAATTPTANT